jgi:hypothetical protein
MPTASSPLALSGRTVLTSGPPNANHVAVENIASGAAGLDAAVVELINSGDSSAQWFQAQNPHAVLLKRARRDSNPRPSA